MKNFFSLIKEIYYLQKFGSYVSKVFEDKNYFKNKKDNKGLVVIELNNLYGSHIAYSFIIDKLNFPPTLWLISIVLYRSSFAFLNLPCSK